MVIFGINTTSDLISKLLYVISRAVRRVKFETILKLNITSGTYAKYDVQIMLLFVYTTRYTHERFVIFTCRYFKLNKPKYRSKPTKLQKFLM